MRHLVPVLLACLAAGVTAGCGTSRAEQAPPTRRPASPPPRVTAEEQDLPGERYTVKPGDTLWSIARTHASSVDELTEVNLLAENAPLAVGQVLFIPAPDPMAPAPPPGPALEQEGLAPDTPPLTPAGDAPPFGWPIKEGVLFSEFGPRQGSHHDGIDLGAPEGSPVVAAADGEVIFSGADNGAYGLLVILKHPGDRVTVYAHNQANVVKEGQRVTAGQVIARVGNTGAAQTPHVHFEVRQGRKPVDPVPLLPVE